MTSPIILRLFCTTTAVVGIAKTKGSTELGAVQGSGLSTDQPDDNSSSLGITLPRTAAPTAFSFSYANNVNDANE
jgi:hypothetical protein